MAKDYPEEEAAEALPEARIRQTNSVSSGTKYLFYILLLDLSCGGIGNSTGRTNHSIAVSALKPYVCQQTQGLSTGTIVQRVNKSRHYCDSDFRSKSAIGQEEEIKSLLRLPKRIFDRTERTNHCRDFRSKG